MVKSIFLFIALISNAFAWDSCNNLADLRKIMLARLNHQESDVNFLPNKKEIKIAIIDTGVNISIPDLRNRIYYPDKDGFGYDFVKNTNKPLDDSSGHGSNVAGLILSINPNAKIIPIKYYDEKASDEQNAENFEKSIKKAIDLNVDIINISGGGQDSSRSELSAIKKAQDKGIIIVSAAGNDGLLLNSKNHYYPASYGLDNIITVMNNDDFGFKNDSSNFGSIIDISTIGTQVKSFSKSNNCNHSLTGTSQATPIVTGVISLMLGYNPNLKGTEIRSLLIKSATKSLRLDGLNRANGFLNIKQTLVNTYNYTSGFTFRISKK